MGGDSVFSSENPLVRVSGPLIDMLVRMREQPNLGDPAALRNKLLLQVRDFEQAAIESRISHEEVIAARYCLCTALDEAAAQTPWGGRGVWAKHSLLVTFHNETWGGEKYFQLLARLAQDPERHANLIELLYYLNALGFEGRFRIVEDGHSQLELLKRRIAAILNKVKGGYEERLSPHWVGVQSQAPVWRQVPLWVVACLCACIAIAAYIWFLFSIAERSDKSYARLAALQVPAKIVSPPPAPAPLPRLRRFLEPEIVAGLVEVNDHMDSSVVTITGDGLFDSGRAEIKQRYLPVLARIAAALSEVEGKVLVTGYTDNVPIRSVRFSSNWHLSQARAEAVKDLLDGYLGEGLQRMRFEGRGEANPVAENTTPEGRAKNRRVEITLLLPAEEVYRQINQNAFTQQTAGGRQ